MHIELSCQFSIYDPLERLWDWTYEAWLIGPGQITLAHSSNYTLNKPGYSSSLATDLDDPDEGEYTCSIDWYAFSSYLFNKQAKGNLYYTVPTGETTSKQGWGDTLETIHSFVQTLTGGNFVGRYVEERSGGDIVDNL